MQSRISWLYKVLRWKLSRKVAKNEVLPGLKIFRRYARHFIRAWKKENARDRTLALVSSQSIIRSRTMENAPGPFQPIRTHEYGVRGGGIAHRVKRGLDIARETSFRLKHTETVWLFMKSSNVLAIFLWIYRPAIDACSMLSIRKSIEWGLYTVNG